MNQPSVFYDELYDVIFSSSSVQFCRHKIMRTPWKNNRSRFFSGRTALWLATMLAIDLATSACGAQRVNFRSDRVPMRRVIETADATATGCNLTIDPDRINAGDAPKVRVGLANGKSIKTLAINGEAMDPTAELQSLTKVKAYGQMKIIAVATDTSNAMFTCSADLTVDPPQSIIGMSLPACSVALDDISISAGQTTKLRLSMLNYDAAKFPMKSVSLIRRSTVANLSEENEALPLPVLFPAIRTINQLGLGRYTWTATVSFEVGTGTAQSVQATQCVASLLVSDGLPSCTASVSVAPAISAVLNANAILSVHNVSNAAGFTFPKDSANSDDRKVPDADGNATFTVKLSQSGTNLFPVRVSNPSGSATSLCVATIDVPAPGPGPTCQISPASASARVLEAKEFRLSRSGDETNFSNVVSKVVVVGSTEDDATESDCVGTALAGSICRSAAFKSGGQKLIRGKVTAKDPNGNDYQRDCIATMNVTEPVAACEVLFASPAAPVDQTRSSVTFAGTPVPVPFSVRQTAASGALQLPIEVVTPDGKTTTFSQITDVGQFTLTSSTGSGDKAFTCVAHGPGGSSTSNSILTVTDQSPSSLGCVVTRNANDTATLIAGQSVRLTLVMTAGNDPLASARLGTQPAVLAANFFKIDERHFLIASDYAFTRQNEIATAGVTDTAGKTATCTPAFEIGNLVELPTCTINNLASTITANVNTPAPTDANLQRFTFTANPTLAISGGNLGTTYTEGAWSLELGAAGAASAYPLIRSGSNVLNNQLTSANFVSEQITGRIKSEITIGGFKQACVSPELVVQRNANLRATFNFGNLNGEVSFKNQTYPCNATTCAFDIPAGAVVQAKASNSLTHLFTGWSSGPCAGGTLPTCTFNIASPVSLATTETLVIRPTCMINGLASPITANVNTPAPVDVNAQRFTFTANPTLAISGGNLGATFTESAAADSWKLELGATGAASTYAITRSGSNVLNNQLASANFGTGTITGRIKTNITIGGYTQACVSPELLVKRNSSLAATFNFGNLNGAVVINNQTTTCNGTCAIDIPAGTQVQARANNSLTHLFTGWSSGPCAGTTLATCTFSISSPASLATTETSVQLPSCTINGVASTITANMNVPVPTDLNLLRFTFTANPTLTVSGGNLGATFTESAWNLELGANGAASIYALARSGSNVLNNQLTSANFGTGRIKTNITIGGYTQACVSPELVVMKQSFGLVLTTNNSSANVTYGNQTQSCRGICNYTIPAGSPVTVTDYPDTGSYYYFSSWSAGPCNGSGSASCNFTMTSAVTMTATQYYSPPPVRCMVTSNSSTQQNPSYALTIVNDQGLAPYVAGRWSNTNSVNLGLAAQQSVTINGNTRTTISRSNLRGTITQVAEDDNSAQIIVNGTSVYYDGGDASRRASTLSVNQDITSYLNYGSNIVSGKVYDAFGTTRYLGVTIAVSYTETTTTETANYYTGPTCPSGTTPSNF